MTACLYRAASQQPSRGLDRSLDLGRLGRLELGEPITAQGGQRIWPQGILASRDCFGPCYDADSAYLFDMRQSVGIAFVVALLDARGRVHAMAAFFQVGHSLDYVYPPWRTRYGPPSCGGPGPSQRLPTWIDSKTAIFFGGGEHRDARIPFALPLVDRVNARVGRYSTEFECPHSPLNNALRQTPQTLVVRADVLRYRRIYGPRRGWNDALRRDSLGTPHA